MSKSSLKLDTRRALNDGTYPVTLKVGYGTNIYLPTGIYLPADEWDARTQMCVGKSAKRINSILSSSLMRVTNRILELRDLGKWDSFTRKQMRQMLLDMSLDAPTVDTPSLGVYIEKVRNLRSGRTVISYSNTLSKLKTYCDPYSVSFSDMTYVWWEEFVLHMQRQGLARNTIVKYLKCIKTVIKYAEEDGINVNPAYKRVNSRAETDTPMRNMSLDAIRRVRDIHIEGKTAMYRDAFMLSFYLIGINMVDLLDLPTDCISNGRLIYKRAKTGKNYSILVQPEAAAIIEKYRGKKHLLCFSEKVKGFRYNCNALLNKLEDGLTWYWARYSWANFAVDLDIPKDTISEALGHSHGSAVTGIYIRYSLDKVDDANRKVIDYLMEK